MPETEDKVTATFKDGKLILSGVSHGWKFEKEIEPIEFSGKNVQVEVNSAELKRAISQQKPKVNIFLVDTEDKKYLMLNLDGADYGESFMINYFIV